MPDQSSSRLSVDALGPQPAREFAHALLFTGHMIDRLDRKQARFPAWAEGRARRAIHDAIAGVEWNTAGATVGLAGGASGGDLLFHECCAELGIATRVLLALAPKEFEAQSVAPAGSGWVVRYETLLGKAGARVQVMQEGDGLLEGPTDNVWQRANLWMIEEAGRLAQERALLALWDGKVGDGPGGTEHFLQVARRCGIRVLPPIRMQSLLADETD
jgi:hypothetical protein